MNKIPTAEELLDSTASKEFWEEFKGLKKQLIEKIIEQNKLHVKAALENAYDCGTFKGWTNSDDDNIHKEMFVKNIISRKQIK